MQRRLIPVLVFACSAVSATPAAADTVRLLALGGDPSRPPSVQTIRREHFSVDASGRPLGLRGPRVCVEPALDVAVRVNRFTFQPVQTIPARLMELAPDSDGGFVACARASPESLAMATAFAATARVIDACERWIGHRIDWGRGGQLAVVAYASILDRPLAWYDHIERVVRLGASASADPLLDTVANPDVVAHEAGHAIVHALKPGWMTGMASALHEALADMIAVLSSLDDPAVLGRVLAATAGDLRLRNEAAALFEGFADRREQADRAPRCVLCDARPEHFGLPAESVDLPSATFDFEGTWDPHLVSLVASGMLYDIFCGLCDREGARTAKELTGALMLRALWHMGEHQVSLQGFASALLRADSLAAAGAHADLIRACAQAHGLYIPADPGHAVPRFRLDPLTTRPADVLERVEALEAMLMVELPPGSCDALALIRHSPRYPFTEEARAQDVSVWSDRADARGWRCIRLRYEVPRRRVEDDGEPLAPAGGFDVFSSLVFDPTGELVAWNVDKPWR